MKKLSAKIERTKLNAVAESPFANTRIATRRDESKKKLELLRQTMNLQSRFKLITLVKGLAAGEILSLNSKVADTLVVMTRKSRM